MAVPLNWASYLLLQDQFLKLHLQAPSPDSLLVFMTVLITAVCRSLPNSALSVWLVLVLWEALVAYQWWKTMQKWSSLQCFLPEEEEGRAKNDVTVFWTLIYQVAVSRSQNSSMTSISLILSQMRGQDSSSITPLSSHGRPDSMY